ncbi:MAG: threonine/serine dehydratase [Clostridia bacterium]
MSLAINLEDIKRASKTISHIINKTSLIRVEGLDEQLGCNVYFKPENLQKTGSFKIRGASNRILNLSEEDKEKGIIASSSGNHAQGVAYAAKLADVDATVVMPKNAPESKVNGTKKYGANVILHGYDSIERYKHLYSLVDQHGYTVVHSFNDPNLIAGQGTVGLEIIQELPQADYVIVPLGGGGVLSGIAVAIKESNPNCKVIGVEPAAIPRFSKSLEKGEPVEVPFKETVADGLMLTKTGDNTWPIVKEYVDEVITVEDKSIKKALKEILMKGKLLVEPSAAIGVAAVMANKLKDIKGKNVVFVLTGGNIDFDKLIELIN